MTIRQPLTLPAYTPTSWELTLPGYPVIVGGFNSVSFPDVLGSLPSDSRWRLRFENVSDEEALALLLPWKATGGGLWPLTELPIEVAGGVNDANFRKRLTGTTWTIEKKPSKESVKNGRFTVTIELVHELTFESIYGPAGPLTDIEANPVLMNLFNVLSVAGVPTALDKTTKRGAALVLNLNLRGDFVEIAGFPSDLDRLLPAARSAGPVLMLAVPATGAAHAAGLPASLDPLLPAERSASAALTLGLEWTLAVAGVSPVKA